MSLQSRHDITKYPNRRFYDGTTSQHVTLTDLYEIVRRGGEIVVTDKESGRDITNIVLTQIILEHDPPKMELFPSSLLHQAIQANESVMRGFIDQYFARALEAFNQSRSHFDQFLKGNNLGATSPFDWARMMMPGMSGAKGRAPDSGHANHETHDAPPSNEAPEPSRSANADDLDAVRQQLAEMREEMARMQNSGTAASKPVAKKKRAKKSKVASRRKAKSKVTKKRSKI